MVLGLRIETGGRVEHRERQKMTILSQPVAMIVVFEKMRVWKSEPDEKLTGRMQIVSGQDASWWRESRRGSGSSEFGLPKQQGHGRMQIRLSAGNLLTALQF